MQVGKQYFSELARLIENFGNFSLKILGII